MPATSGIAFVIKVNTGTEAAPVWTQVAGQRGATLNRSTEAIDVGSKDDNFWPAKIPGRREWSIDFDGLLIEGDAGLSRLSSAYQNNTRVQVQMVTPANEKFQGYAILADFPYEAPHDAEATYSGTLEGASALSIL